MSGGVTATFTLLKAVACSGVGDWAEAYERSRVARVAKLGGIVNVDRPKAKHRSLRTAWHC